MICTCNREGDRPGHFQSAFTIVETLLGSVLSVIVFSALLIAIAYGFGQMRASTENSRATEILLERMEGVRLYTWNQLVSSNWLNLDFYTYYSPPQGTNAGAGALYHGTISVTTPTLNPPASYSGDMRQVTVTVTWTNYGMFHQGSGNMRQRSMSTYVSAHGVQNYDYSH
jgi:hypothetical protein